MDKQCLIRGGASAVDYLIVENSIHQKVENLKILPSEFDSKHTTMTATFRINTLNNSVGKLLNTPKVYKWCSQGSTNFRFLINCRDSKMKAKAASKKTRVFKIYRKQLKHLQILSQLYQ